MLLSIEKEKKIKKRKAPDYSNEVKELLDGKDLPPMEAIALSCGVSPSAVWTWIHGVKSPSKKNFEKLKSVLTSNNTVITERRKSMTATPPPAPDAKPRLELPGTIEQQLVEAIIKSIAELPGVVNELSRNLTTEFREIRNALEDLKKNKSHCPDCHHHHGS